MLEMMTLLVAISGVQAILNIVIYKEKPNKPAGPMVELTPEN